MIGSQQRTLKQQLVLMNIATTGVAVLVAIALLFAVELRTWKEAFVAGYRHQGGHYREPVHGGLTFWRDEGRRGVLAALREDLGSNMPRCIRRRAGRSLPIGPPDGPGGPGRAAAGRPPLRVEPPGTDPAHPPARGADRYDLDPGTPRRHPNGAHAVLRCVPDSALSGPGRRIGPARAVPACGNGPVTDLAKLMERVSRTRTMHGARESGTGRAGFAGGSFNEMLRRHPGPGP